MAVDGNSPVPIFQQIADHIRRSVAAGVYRAGEGLPSTRALAIELGVNPNTVQRAYEELERQGLVASKKGTGMIVAASAQSVAQNGAAKSIKSALAQAIALARDAGMGRASIDKIYRAVCNETDWSETPGRQS